MILAAVGVTVALIYTKTVLIPFFIAICIYTVMVPMIDWINKKTQLPGAICALFILLFFILVMGLLTLMLVSSFGSFMQGTDLYYQRILDFVQSTTAQAEAWGLPIDRSAVIEQVRAFPIFSTAKNLTGNIFSIIGSLFLVSIFVIFLLAGRTQSEAKAPKLFEEIQNKISKYIVAKTLISSGTALLVWLVLFLCNVDLAIMFAILTFFFNFIPNIGSIISTVMPLPIVFLQFGLGWSFFLVLGLITSIQMLIGNFLEPKILGDSMELHPISVLLFLMFWGLVWGLPGMFLAVPITAIMRIVMARFEPTRPLAELLAGRMNA